MEWYFSKDNHVNGLEFFKQFLNKKIRVLQVVSSLCFKLRLSCAQVEKETKLFNINLTVPIKVEFSDKLLNLMFVKALEKFLKILCLQSAHAVAQPVTVYETVDEERAIFKTVCTKRAVNCITKKI
jgi:hypothetical protein